MLECVANVSEGRDAAALRAGRDALRRVAPRRAHRPRPSPIGVHARRSGPRRRRARGARPRRRGRDRTSRSPATTACTRGSVRSTSCRSSALGGTDAERAQAADAARDFGAVVGGDARRSGVPLRRRRPRRARSSAHPARRVHDAPTRLRSGRAASDARRDRGRSPQAARRDQPLARDAATSRWRVASRGEMRERRRRAAGRARARPHARVEGAAAGVDEPGRPRPHRHRGRVPPRCGSSRVRERTEVASVELVGLVPPPELDRCSDGFLAWAGLDASTSRSKPASAAGPAGGRAPTRPGSAGERRSRRPRRWRGRAGRGRAGGGCDGAPARTSRPRSRTSRRGAVRTRGIRS